jgi:PAP2 superfamily
MEWNRQVLFRNARLVAPIALIQCTIYFYLNHFPPFPSRTLPLTWIDDAIPFWPWTMWPYLVMIFGPVVLPLFIRQEQVIKQTLWAYIPGYATTFAFHALWPTHSERPVMPEDGTFQSWAYRCLTTLDAPHSCFPSGHIVGPLILCWAFWKDGYRLGTWLLLAFPLFSLTILTTKQHYFWDWLGGFAVATAAIGFSYLLSGPGEQASP